MVVAVLVQLGGGGWIKLAGALIVWAVPYDLKIAIYLLPAAIVLNFVVFRFARPDLPKIPLGPAIGTVGVIMILYRILPILAAHT
ncbi:hypothetical protein GO499_15015 [Algicella marina]|uniref:Uncharacterized protein n=1 Tax=Algicella marina TaxID=2683284 RepID=A0A6P1T739_9RHOB|nr:hypothetical protein GO499_15015 [Algicella marina]